LKHSNINSAFNAYAFKGHESNVFVSILLDVIMKIQKGELKYDASNGAYTFTLKEKVKQVTRSNGTATIKKTTYAIIPITDEARSHLPEYIGELRSSGGNNTKYGTDSTGTVDAYVTVYYDTTTINEKEYVYLTKISGGCSADGSGSIISGGITVSGHSVTYGQTGIGTAGKGKAQNTSHNIGNSNRSFNITPPSSWIPVAAESQIAAVGANYIITLTRGSGSWKCEIINSLSF